MQKDPTTNSYECFYLEVIMQQESETKDSKTSRPMTSVWKDSICWDNIISETENEKWLRFKELKYMNGGFQVV